MFTSLISLHRNRRRLRNELFQMVHGYGMPTEQGTGMVLSSLQLEVFTGSLTHNRWPFIRHVKAWRSVMETRAFALCFMLPLVCRTSSLPTTKEGVLLGDKLNKH